NLRRIDRNLIDTAFVEHGSGLRVLPADVKDDRLDHYSSSEVFLLTATLRQNFDQVLINMTGQPDSEMLRNLVGQADQLCWYVDPCLSGSLRNLQLLKQCRDNGVKLDHAQLLVDRYCGSVALAAKALGRTFYMRVLGSLPASAELRMSSRN